MKFTVQNTEGLKLASGEQDRIWFDDVVPGFGLRVRESRQSLLDFSIQAWSPNAASRDRCRSGDQSWTCP